MTSPGRKVEGSTWDTKGWKNPRQENKDFTTRGEWYFNYFIFNIEFWNVYSISYRILNYRMRIWKSIYTFWFWFLKIKYIGPDMPFRIIIFSNCPEMVSLFGICIESKSERGLDELFALGCLIKERLIATGYFKSSQLVIIITHSIGRRGNIF